ncbi:hypothetical protein [Neptunomonas japonica]|uniref:Uncharacterized protein n=1 Tax=Neptunomonas japonica JAMM 1380 TaxID=1441457 RepID=A0A7R6P6A3_9GAMM|nr:hypothetical protein [Neptunomonas japonica]BBB28054.1 conserved hypothetical protein [Neptunomonas japonica JAMM 1380]
MDISNTLVNEWNTLQTQSDSYEKHSLYIKLLAIAITASTALLIAKTSLYIVIILAILWLQDAIWKTFQARISDRLIKVETALQETNSANNLPPCQLNSEWLAKRSGFVGLIKEYLCHAVRPTIAFPYILLIGLILCI